MANSAGALGDDNYQVASIRASLAELLLEQGRLDEAETLFTRSFEVRDRILHDSLFALASREGLARVAAARGDLAGAEATLRQILDARRHSDLPPGLPLAATLLALGEVLLARGQAVAARTFPARGPPFAPGEFEPRHKDVAAVRGVLGASLVAQRRYAEAEPLLVESLAGLRGRSAVADQAEARLVRLYEAWGRPEKADAYRGIAARRWRERGARPQPRHRAGAEAGRRTTPASVRGGGADDLEPGVLPGAEHPGERVARVLTVEHQRGVLVRACRWRHPP